jgi:hypothetical protein
MPNGPVRIMNYSAQKSDQSHQGSGNGSNRRTVVTLVRGTRVLPWESVQADWTRAESSICRALRKALDCELRVFHWNGKNSFRAREKASIDLEAFLESGLSDYRTARHFVIAHSHGGNLVMRTLGRRSFDVRISGIAFLATPFLHVSRRSTTVLGSFVYGLVAVALPFIVFLVALGTTVAVTKTEINASFAVGLLIAAGAGIWSRVLIKALADRIFELIEALSRNQWPALADMNILILRSTSDEASIVLASAQFARWLIEFLGRIPIALIDFAFWLIMPIETMVDLVSYGLESHGLKLFPLAALCAFGGLYFSGFVEALTPRSALVLLIVSVMLIAMVYELLGPLVQILVLGIALSTLAAFTATAFALAAPLVLISLGVMYAFSFGEDLLCIPWFDISAETTPPGVWKVTLLNSSTGLRHSVHSDPLAVQEIANWIAEAPFE